MKALSTKQPFAGLIASGQKKYETRTWQTKYRGPLLICAGQRTHPLFDFYDFRSGILGMRNHNAADRYEIDRGLIRTGVMVCVVDLVDVVPFEKEMQADCCCDWYPDSFAWKLENPRQVEQINLKGKLNLFEVDDSLIKYFHQTKKPISAEPQKIAFIRQQISGLEGRSMEVSAEFIRQTIDESRQFLAHNPLDVLRPDFDRDKARLEKYLNVEFRIAGHGVYAVIPGK